MEKSKEVNKLIKRLIVSIIVVLLFPATALAVDYAQSPETAQDHELVYIPDPILKTEVLYRLNIIEDRDVTFGEMKTIERLICNRGVQDLTGIEYAINLETLSACAGKYTNLESLRTLKQITDINLSSSEFTSIEPIIKLPITHLLLSYCKKINDIDLIWSMDNLDNLVYLNLCGMNLDDSYFRKLDRSINLIRIDLDKNNMESLYLLSKLPKLKKLCATSNKISDLSYVANMQSIYCVRLNNNEIADISPLISAFKNSVNRPDPVYDLECRLYNNYIDVGNESPTHKEIEQLELLINNAGGEIGYSSKDIPIEVQSISMDQTEMNIKVGETASLQYLILPENATVKNVRWKSSNEDAVTITSDGVITAIKPDEAEISAITLNKGYKAICKVTVKQDEVQPEDQPRIVEFHINHNDKTYPAIVNQDNLTISLNIDGNTKHFVPNFVLDNSGIVSIDGVIQESGVSVVDFSNPVFYTVKSEDSEEGTVYTVTVTGTKVDECFIATACFGSINEPAVKLLRQFRDKFLLTNTPGQALVSFYYSNSPPLADYIRQSEGKKLATRIILMPLIVIAYICLNPIWLILIVVISIAVVIRKRSVKN